TPLAAFLAAPGAFTPSSSTPPVPAAAERAAADLASGSIPAAASASRQVPRAATVAAAAGDWSAPAHATAPTAGAVTGAPAAQPTALSIAVAALSRGAESNNFAVDGTLSASGKPLLSNDLHFLLTTPSFAYLAAITVRGGGAFEGVTIPGLGFF